MRDCLKIQLNLRIEMSEKVESNGFHLERGAISEVTVLFLTRGKDQSRKKGTINIQSGSSCKTQMHPFCI